MLHSNHLKAKAAAFNIDLGSSPDRGIVLVCKYMLNGIAHTLSQDPRKISREYIDVLEEDLREIRNEFEGMSSQEAKRLITLKLVKSVSAIKKFITVAHREVCTASMMIDNGSSETNYTSYFDCLNHCRLAVNSARQSFLIESASTEGGTNAQADQENTA